MLSGIEELLRQTIGLEASSIGTATVERMIRGRMLQVGAATPEDYLRLLRENPDELAELIESVVIPESWFFRDGAPFTALVGWNRDKWLPTHPGATLRVLTIPCSTGEEPYSVAMALLDAGLPPERFTVDAVDISQRALARARRAVYGQNSFRGQALDFRERYFVPVPEGHALSPEVRRQVRFEHGNLLADNFRPGAGRFDVIFCRNVLIYFDRPTQLRAVQTLAGMLAGDGLLFVGHAETGIAAAAGFVTAKYPMSFAFHKAALPVAQRAPSTGIQTRLLPRMPSAPGMRNSQPPATRSLPFETPRTLPLPHPTVSPSGDLGVARKRADEGKLDEARQLCEAALRQNGASAAAWYLLGVVSDAAGDRRRAAECYTKTLYLEPDHQEALLQRALLAEGSGDLTTAAQLRRRMQRVQERRARP